MVRILYEPLFLLALSIILPNFYILQASAAHYLTFAAFALGYEAIRCLVHAVAVLTRPHGHAQRRPDCRKVRG